MIQLIGIKSILDFLCQYSKINAYNIKIVVLVIRMFVIRKSTTPFSNPPDQRKQQTIEKIKEGSLQMRLDTTLKQLEFEVSLKNNLTLKLNEKETELNHKLEENNSLKQKIQQLSLQYEKAKKTISDQLQAQQQKQKDQQTQNSYQIQSIRLKVNSQMSVIVQQQQKEKKALNDQIAKLNKQLLTTKREYNSNQSTLVQLKQNLYKIDKELKEKEQQKQIIQSQLIKNQKDFQQQKATSSQQLEQFKKDLQKSMKVKFQTQLQQSKWIIKAIESSASQQKQQLEDKLLISKHQNQQLQLKYDQIIQQLTKTKENLKKKQAENQKLSEQLYKITQSFNEKINAIRQSENISRSQQFKKFQAHVNESIAAKMANIQKEHINQLNKLIQKHQNQLKQKQLSHDQLANKLKQQGQQHLKQIEQLQHKSRQTIDQLKKQQNKKITQIEDLLKKVTNLVLNKSQKVIDKAIVIEDISTKIALSNSFTQNLQQKCSLLHEQKSSLESCLSQVKQWLISMNVLVNSSSADQALQRKRQYGISDANLLTSINTFTSNLQQRLKKHRVHQQELNGQIAQLREELDHLKTEKGGLQEILAEFTKQNQYLEASLKNLTTQKDRLEKDGQKNQAIINRLNKELQDKKKLVAQKQGEIITLTQEIKIIQTIKVPAFTQKISQETSKADQLMVKLQKYQPNLKALQECKLLLEKQLKNQKFQSEERLKRIEEVKKQLIAKEFQWKSLNEIQFNKLRQVINQLFQYPPIQNSFESLLQYLKNNKPTKSAPLTVSAILQSAPKERKILEGHIYKLLECRSFTSKLLYKYDEFNKNFSNYIPTREAYDFVFMVKSTKGHIFGVICYGVGLSSKAAAFNLTSGKLFLGQNASSYKYDGGYLNFGQGEIRFRSGSNLQIIVNTRIFGSRCFTFTKQELVGSDNVQQPQLEAMQIHRINH